MNIIKRIEDIINENLSEGNEDSFFVLNLEDVERKLKIWKQKLSRITPFYAVKCNDNEDVLRTLMNLGTGFDCASKKEILQMLDHKVDPKMIIYANTVKQVSHLKFAAEKGIQKLTFDCSAELEKIKKYHPIAEVVLRIRFDAATSILSLGEKFGCNPVTEAPKLIKLCRDMEMNMIGISFHVGSGATDCNVFEGALDAVKKLFDYAETLNMKLKFIDIGGGFIGSEIELFEKIAKSINSAIERNFPSKDIEIIAEPGRYFVDTAFSMVTQVILKRKSEDGQIYYYINESYYMSFLISKLLNMDFKFTQIKRSKVTNKQMKMLSTIWGCTCSAHDKIIPDIEMTEIDIDDWLVFHDMGAYTLSASTTFNGFSNRKVVVLKRD